MRWSISLSSASFVLINPHTGERPGPAEPVS